MQLQKEAWFMKKKEEQLGTSHNTSDIRLAKSMEEDAVFAAHTDDFWEQSEALTQNLYHQIFDDVEPDPQKTNAILEKSDDFRATIGISRDLLLIYIVSGITMVTEEAIRRGVPHQTAMEIKRRAFVALSEKKSLKDWYTVSNDVSLSLRSAYQSTVKSGGAKHPLVRKACDYIYTHRTEPLTARDVAAYLGVDRTYLAKLFAEDLDTTISDYILSIKMREAAVWLSKENYALPEIATNLGFSSYSYFSRRFQQYYHVSPSRYAQDPRHTNH